ncbi:hypothetical protein CMV_022873 [Castanea mollissima]|uniref:Uncharacterized protein n=1 Tax=Castanea mollissima TaxID=60419 RepID=A0A8J4VJV7_9ROSI|nr:hypothetical protein CMV_022873 [Castanea mollissima]
MRPPWDPPKDLSQKWTWLANSGPFITNGEVKDSQILSSDTESDSVTVAMFNLDKLNDVRPEIIQGSTGKKDTFWNPQILLLNLSEDQGWEQNPVTLSVHLSGSRKRLRREFEKFRRNIRQRLFCGLFRRTWCTLTWWKIEVQRCF